VVPHATGVLLTEEGIMAMNIVILISSLIVAAGAVIAVVLKKTSLEKAIGELNSLEDKIKKSEEEAQKILENVEKEASARKKEIEIKAKENAYKLKEEAEKEIKASKVEIYNKEQRLTKKEESLDIKLERIEEQKRKLEKKEKNLEVQEKSIDDLKLQQEAELERISGLSKTDAKDMLLTKLNDELTHETAIKIREFENKMDEEKERISKRILSTAINKSASEYVVESTISVVQLPNDEMKGRIIGREGRNIRAIESMTGVDVIIDDTPEAVVLSSFDSVRREVARIAIEKLVTDGRIHPAKIEESVNKAQKEVNKAIIEAGEHALLELGVTGMHQEIVKTLGKLRYRTSYGQNVLTHSIEVGKLASTLAAEIGGDAVLAKRAGLLHDVGKALDHDIEGSHAIIGAEFLRKFGEKENVINAVAAHHCEAEFGSVEAVLVQASDAISASRPGARRETLSTYIKRLESLEGIANSFEGVESSYAIQAGREVRIIVNPDEMNDDQATKMSRDIANKVEETMQYPGQIKVTVIRETRSVEYAK
jgi:ribonuclease Y